MTGLAEPIRRVDGKRFGRRTHWYEDATGARIPGVTSLLGDGLPKKALVGWGIRSVAEFAVDHWLDLSALPVSERVKRLKGAPYAERDAAANRGTEVHALAERLAHGEEVEVPDEIAGYVDAYVRFLDDHKVEAVHTEATVYHTAFAYAGSLDLIARLGGYDGLCLIDLKTSKGVYGETALQVAAYRYADRMLTDDGPVPMPEIAHTFVCHIRDGAYSLLPIEAGRRQLEEFRHVARVARVVADCPDYIGEAV